MCHLQIVFSVIIWKGVNIFPLRKSPKSSQMGVGGNLGSSKKQAECAVQEGNCDEKLRVPSLLTSER